MANDNGTNLFIENGDTGVKTALTNDALDAVLVHATTANIPSGKAGYAVGCLLMNTTTGTLFINQGTVASCSFQDVNRY